MSIEACKLSGIQTPQFLSISDTAGIWSRFRQDGIVFVEGVTESSLVTLSQKFGRIFKPRNDVSGTGVSNIRYAPGLTGKGYSTEELFLHTDRGGWDSPPQVLLTVLKCKSTTGGESLLADSHAIREYIRSQDPALFSLVTGPKHTSFRADDGTFVLRPIFDTNTGITRFRYDDGCRFSAPLIDRLPDLKSIIYKHAFAFTLQPGQSYIVDNHRFLHGRTSFTGPRELLRTLVYSYPSKPFKIVLWDVDGTLCKAEALSIDAYYRCISHVAGREITHANTPINYHGQTDRSLLHAILQYHGTVNQECEISQKFFDAHPKYLEDSVRKGLRSIQCPGAGDVLDWLVQVQRNLSTPLVLGLLAGNSRASSLLKLSEAGFDVSVFDLGISAFGDVHVSRATMFNAALDLLVKEYGVVCVPAKDILVIGDTPLDVECAKLAGCGIVSVSTGSYSKEQLEACLPDIAVDSLVDAKEHILSFLTC